MREYRTWRSRGRRFRVVSGVVALALLGYPVLNVLLEATGVTYGPRWNDFGAYYNAGLRLLEGAPLYARSSDVPALAGTTYADMRYLYPPLVAVLFVPFALLPFPVAGALWTVATTAALFAGVYALVRALDVDLSAGGWVVLLWMVVGFAPSVTRIKTGQISGLLAALLCVAAAALAADGRQRAGEGGRASGGGHGQEADDDRGPPGEGDRSPGGDGGGWPGEVDWRSLAARATGVPVALAAFVKPFYLPAGAYLLRRRRALLWSGAAGVAAVAASVGLLGLEVHRTYLDVLLGGKSWKGTPPPRDWYATLFFPFYLAGGYATALRGALALWVVGVVGASRRRAGREADLAAFALGVAVVPVLNPAGTVQNMNVLVPAYLVLVVDELRRGRGYALALLASVLLVHVHPYTVEFVAKFGPRHVPPVAALAPLLPVVQPAMWGIAVLVAVASLKALGVPAGAVRTRVPGASREDPP